MESYGHKLKLLEKTLGGHHTCLGDIVQNISKMGDILLIFWGEPWASLQKSH